MKIKKQMKMKFIFPKLFVSVYSSTFKWLLGTLTTLLDQTGSAPNTLASLASLAGAITSSAFDNTSNLYFWADFEFNVTFAIAPTAGKTLDLYILESVDGTNYGDGSGGATPVTNAGHFVGSVPVRNVNTAQRITLRGIPIPPTKFQIMMVNSTDQALVATAQTLKMQPYTEQAV